MSQPLFTTIRRFPFIVGCTFVAIAALAANLWIIDKAQAYDRELEDLNREGDSLLDVIANRSLLERELDLVKLAVNRTEDNLVIEDNLAENLWYFYSIENRARTRLTDLHQQNGSKPGANDKYRLIPYDLRVTGDFLQVAEFLRLLETGPRLLHLSRFTMRRVGAAEGSIEMELEIELLGKK